jgi:Tol biopolymer transport system component
VRGIHLWEAGVVTRLSAADQEDTQPHSAAGSIVFRSRRDGNGEIYIASDALQGQLRLTNDAWDDTAPALSPDGSEILFVSNRSGTPRLWIMGADGGNQRLFATGSQGFVPEAAPAWRPSGDQVAFTSTRTGTSQVFVVPSAGGTAVQITHETTGAFLPAWSGDGRSVLYTTLEGGSLVRLVPSAGGEWRALAAGATTLHDAACSGDWCLVVSGLPGEDDGDILSVSRVGRAPRSAASGDADEREPAFLVR